MIWKVPLFKTDIGQEEIGAVTRVLRSGWLTMGEETEAFEKEFATYIGAKHALAVSSCTSALLMANLSLSAGIGDEVICPSLTFVATANSILYTGARPVFADINGFHDLNISPVDIEEKITGKTRGIVVVHYAGYPCDMNRINEIAEHHDLYVIEDCAHAAGSTYKGRMVGTLGDIGCFSFFSNKNLSTGEGGMLTTNSEDLFKKLKLLRSHGMTSLTLDRHKGHAFSYDVVSLGYNFRIDEIRAALGRVQLKKIDYKNERRRSIFQTYKTCLKDASNILIPFDGFEDYSGKLAFHIFPILIKEPLYRKKLMDGLRNKGIQTSIHYPPIHRFSYYAEKFDFIDGMLPETELAAKEEITLPLFPDMNNDEVANVSKTIMEILDA